MFKTQFDSHDRVYSHPGNRYRIVYSSKVLPSGDIDLVESGSDDLYAYIQSFKDSTDINVIISRYNNGDFSALNRSHPSFLDLTVFPKTFSDTLNLFINAEDTFNNLPIDVRSRFGFDINKFISSMDNPDLFNSLITGVSSDNVSSDNVSSDNVSSDSISSVGGVTVES